MPPESVIPSSPPLLPANFTRSSPPLAEEGNDITPAPLPRGQKRLYQEAGYEPSSEEDPPVFSSDDWPPPEYLARYRRNSGHLAVSRRKRRVLFSAQYLSSDFSESSEVNLGRSSDIAEGMGDGDEGPSYDDGEDEGDTSIQTIRPRREEGSDGLHSEESIGWVGSSAKTAVTEITLPGSDDSFSDFWRKPDPSRLQTRAESAANRIIQNAIEDGIEDIDLSGINLSEVPAEISSLNSLISQPHILAESEALPASYYAPLTPLLRLYLGKNSISKLAPQLFTLEKLTTLSIRNNRLSEIPPWIGKLKDLRELVIGGNHIAFLPWELLQLDSLGRATKQSLVCWPNPLVEPEHREDVEDGISTTPEPVANVNRYHIRSSSSRHIVRRFVNSSDVFLFDHFGKCSAMALGAPSRHPPSSWPALLAAPKSGFELRDHLPCPKSQLKLKDESVCKVPSLIELSLRALSMNRTWATAKDYQRKYFYDECCFPEHLSQLIELALNDSAGGQQGWMKNCGVCRAEYVIPAAEWIEWWDFLPVNNQNPPGNGGADGTGADSTVNPNNPTVIFAAPDGDERRNNLSTRLPLLRRACTTACAQAWLLERYPQAK